MNIIIQSTGKYKAFIDHLFILAHRYPIDDNDDDFEYYPTRPDSDAETGHPQMEVVHLPNLEEGPVSLNPAFRLHLEKQVTIAPRSIS